MRRRPLRASVLCVVAAVFAVVSVAVGSIGTRASAVSQGLPGKIAFSRQTPFGQQVFTVNADGTDVRQVSDELTSVAKPMWTGDGSRIVYIGWPILISVAADGSDRRAVELSYADTTNSTGLSPDGSKLAFFDGTKGVLAIENVDGTDVHTIFGDGYITTWPTWTPDGSHIVFSHVVDTAPYDRTIWIIGADGSDPHEIANTNGGSEPSISPDGSTIAMVAAPGESAVELVGIDGSGRYAIGPVGGRDEDPVWSPDGSKIAFTHFAVDYSSPPRLWVMNADGTNAHQLIEGDARNPDWQPTPVPPGETTTTFLRTTTTSTSTSTTTTSAPNIAPRAVITSYRPSPLTLAVAGDHSADPDGSIVAWQWNWGDYSTATHTKIASHKYAKAGDYLVRLTVKDNRGAVSATSLWVRIR
ncbi:MAG: TolB protein [Actinomycetota bacterium]|jgi:TolB protein